MREAANFLNALIEGKTLSDLQNVIRPEIEKRRQEIDVLAHDLVESGLAGWDEGGTDTFERLIVRGRSNLFDGHADMRRRYFRRRTESWALGHFDM